MLRNYLSIAFRNVLRNKGFAFLNVVGLAVGLAACLLIGLYVRHELSYDRFHDNADQVFRVVQATASGGVAVVPPGVPYVVETEFPEVKHATEVWRSHSEMLFGRGEERFYVENVFRADSAFFRVFPYPLLRGDPQHALAGPNSMVLSRSLAERLFGDQDPVGQVLTVENQVDFTVTGVMEDVPTNAHYFFEALLTLSPYQQSVRYGTSIQWNFFGGHLYVELTNGADPVDVEQRLTVMSDAAERHGEARFELEPLPSIYLLPALANEIGPKGDVRYLYLFSVVGLIILLIACVNYVNLAIARSVGRAREVGVRKVVGARRIQLVRQFLGESVVLGLLAFPLAVGLAAVALPWVNALTGQALRLDPGLAGTAALAGVVLLVSLVAGLYPAVFLSGFQPIAVLRGRLGGRSGAPLRRGLTTFQFAASVALIVGALVVQRQLDYIQAHELGFDTEHVITFPVGVLDERYEAFKQELDAHAAVAATTSGPAMGIGHMNMSMATDDEATGERKWLSVFHVDHDYLETMGLRLTAGRSFSREFGADAEQAVILTPAAVQVLGLEGDPLGQTVQVAGERTVIGLIEDVHNRSLKDPLQALAITLKPGNNWTGLVRLAAGDPRAGLAATQTTWERFLPDRPFSFAFLDDRIQAQYQTERRLGRIVGIFSGLAILIACLGLFGLAAFSAEARTREVGIRKVLGASVGRILALLSSDFVRLVVIGFVIAAPIAYWAMDRWLENFAYRITLGPGIFLLAGGAALAIALLTVGYHALRAATADPVRAIRSE